MQLKIRRAAVLGSGVMGAQIAAHLAAAGVRTYLLDLPSTEPPTDPKLAKAVASNPRSARAILAIEQLKKLKPSPLMSLQVLNNLIPGNFDDDMPNLVDADWVIEAVAEKIDIKQSIHRRILEHARPGVPVTTNTSGILLHDMLEGFPDHYKSVMFGTHFFNPPRYMRLVEIIPHSLSNKDLVHSLSRWIEERLGKGIVMARDTINFIANRIGVFNIQVTLKHMVDLGLNVETVDALTGKFMGRPSSATFRTMDVVGLDTFAHVARNVFDKVPNDPYREIFKIPAWVEGLIQKGHLGQKTDTKGGFYRKSKDAQGKTAILSYRPSSESYDAQQVMDFPWTAEASKISDTIERLKFILQQKDAGADLIWRILRDTLSYSALLLEEIAAGAPRSLDEGMRWGFNWEWGPFELWQGLGVDGLLARMQDDHTKLPAWAKSGVSFYSPTPGSIPWKAAGATSQHCFPEGKTRLIDRPSHVFALPRFRNPDDRRVVESNASASLVDIGDGVACLAFHSKMNAIDSDILDLMQKSMTRVHRDFDAMVVGNDGDNFSAGANLKLILEWIQQKNWTAIDRLLRDFQGSMQLMKFAPFPVVCAPHGLTLGGGCEVALHGAYRVAAGETYAGLVEMGVGLIPAGGGTKELALRAYQFMNLAERGDPAPFLQRAFMLIGMAKTSTSGQEAIEMGLLPATTAITLSRDHQILRAKETALHLSRQGYVAPTPALKVKVWGDPGIQTFKMMLYNMQEGRQISAYDALIGEKIATVLCGGEVDQGSEVGEQYFLELERRVFLELCQQPKTTDRIMHMLKTGKPLRN